MTVEMLSTQHLSKLRNPLIADVFHRIGAVEIWGRGTNRVIDECKRYGNEPPTFEEKQGYLVVTFRADVVAAAGKAVSEKMSEKILAMKGNYMAVDAKGDCVTRSLASLVDQIEEQRFFGKSIPAKEALAAAREIASRQGLPGSYADMFAPTELDFKQGIRVFTGEPVRSGLATSHILGEECCRLLLELGVKDKTVSEALARAEAGMLSKLNTPDWQDSQHLGFFCCGICTASFWRHLAAGGLDRSEPRFKDGLRVLAGYRTDTRGWRRFPFYYTLLALTEIDLPAARDELRWAAPAAERSLKVLRGAGHYVQRRRAVLERALSRVEGNLFFYP